MNTTPVTDGSKPAPAFARVYFADSLGRCMPQAFDQFRSRAAAAAYWWMLARKSVVAFLPDENGIGQSNAGLQRANEPRHLAAAIDQAEREWDDEAAGFSEGSEFVRLCTQFGRDRAATPRY